MGDGISFFTKIDSSISFHIHLILDEGFYLYDRSPHEYDEGHFSFRIFRTVPT